MSVASGTFYWAACDYPGCTSSSREYTDHGDGSVFDTPEDVETCFDRLEGGFADDYGWLRHEGKFYCHDHNVWDDEADGWRPVPESPGSLT